MTEAQLLDLAAYATSDAFAPLERLVVAYAEAMTQTPLLMPEALFEALGQHFTNEQLVELTGVIAWENYRARFNHAFGIEAQGFSEGGAT
ncbi:MAG: carboxymuconolactone decarboxylase family protein [Dehalococcoidia bacterium]